MPVTPSLRRQAGFTLAEIAIVLIIITILAGVFLLPLGNQIEARKRAEAREQLENIRAALVGFAIIHGRLPCPTYSIDPANTEFGMESSTSPPCAVGTSDGYVPWRQLAVPARDPWGQFWHYRVDPAFADSIDRTTSTGQNIVVRDHDGTALSLTTTDTAVFVVYSVATNTAADGRNASFETGINAEYEAGEPTTTFDDMLTWMGRPLLFARLAEASALTSP